MKYLVLFFLCSFAVNAEDGLFARFVFDKQEIGSNSLQSYNTGVLADFNSSNTLKISNLYQIAITNRVIEDGKVNIYFSLKDTSTGKPYNVGADARDFIIGQQESFEFNSNGYIYTVSIDTSFGKLP
ncbi:MULTISPECIES: hypothetical protein [unclassified Alteromonas]|uniref:hypothetical protein n=1 Tax=unclassified Alteromonas TaxID=2614992 RepID=UPI0005095DCA|nr:MULTISPECIES: hypothetical protein [unclassified Alteromonas]